MTKARGSTVQDLDILFISDLSRTQKELSHTPGYPSMTVFPSPSPRLKHSAVFIAVLGLERYTLCSRKDRWFGTQGGNVSFHVSKGGSNGRCSDSVDVSRQSIRTGATKPSSLLTRRKIIGVESRWLHKHKFIDININVDYTSCKTVQANKFR